MIVNQVSNEYMNLKEKDQAVMRNNSNLEKELEEFNKSIRIDRLSKKNSILMK